MMDDMGYSVQLDVSFLKWKVPAHVKPQVRRAWCVLLAASLPEIAPESVPMIAARLDTFIMRGTTGEPPKLTVHHGDKAAEAK